MDLDYYQENAALTDQFPDKKADGALMIPLLGIAGETGTLLSEFKKKIRDKESYEGFKERAEEELGDILWYVSNVATHLGLTLSSIAAKNLHKTQERWPMNRDEGDSVDFFDSAFPESEQFAREMDIRIVEGDPPNKIAQMLLLPAEERIGDKLTDNAYDDDGYRFHDVMHLAHLAVLGWSPVMRRLLNRKRKSNPTVDEVEDGARAAILEELIVAYVYTNARDRKYYEGIRHLDTDMLSTVKKLVAHLEVNRRKAKDWERAILQGYTAFRHLNKRRRAIVRVDMNRRQLKILE